MVDITTQSPSSSTQFCGYNTCTCIYGYYLTPGPYPNCLCLIFCNMADVKTSQGIVLPRKLFKNGFGFGIDFGSSILKLAYTEEVGENLHVHLTNFARDEFDKMLHLLKEKCEDTLQAGGEYNTTGIGVGTNVQDFEETLGVKCKIGNEEVNMIDAFNYLIQHIPWENLVYPANLDIRKAAAETTRTLCNEVLPDIFPPDSCDEYHWNGPETDHPISSHIQYPTILSLVGSGHYIDKVEKDGKYCCLDFYTIAGRTFLGLGKLLTGAETYEDVMKLAAAGSASNLDQPLCEIQSSLSGTHSTTKGFSFGAAADTNKENMKKEDMAAALVSMIANSTAQDAYNWAKIEDIHQVFFIGGVVANNEIFRAEVEREFYEKCYANEKRHICDCFFVRCGGHLPAIGSLLLNLEII